MICKKLYSTITQNLNMVYPKVLLTKTLPPASQSAIENSPDIELIHWKDGLIPRHELLKRVKGKVSIT